jgi:aryl-alcohol dehydrogenase-like predicted oxidoreductase
MNRRDFIRSFAAAVAAAGVCENSFATDVLSERESAKRAIPKRRLGRTGVDVTVLVLGGVVGMLRTPSAEFNPAELANAALDMGITYFDTAPSYGNGQSERNYGEVLATRRNEVFLATKTGQRSYDGALREVESSLERLRTDHVDLLQIHGVGSQEDLARWSKPDGVLRALHKLRDEKTTRFIGVTGHDSAEMMRRAIEMYDFDTILTTFNPTAKRRPFAELVLPAARKKKMGILGMKIMGGGIGSLALGNPIKNDGASNHDEAARQAESAALIRYGLGLPITAAVVGMGSLEQLQANIHAARDLQPLNKEEQTSLEELMAKA